MSGKPGRSGGRREEAGRKPNPDAELLTKRVYVRPSELDEVKRFLTELRRQRALDHSQNL